MTEHQYGWKQLHEAASTLAIMDRPLAERLAMALQEVSLIQQKNLPAEIWEDVKQLVAMGSRGPQTGTESVFTTTTRAMDEVELHDMAEKLFSCFVKITQQQG